MATDYKKIEKKYINRKGGINIGQGLIEPCLANCSFYRRGSAFFSSSSLKTYAASIDRLIMDGVKIEILCSPVVQDKRLVEILSSLATQEDRSQYLLEMSENALLLASGLKDDPNNIDHRSKILSYMIASGQLEIRFAIPKDYDELVSEGDYESLYHVKNGYFEFPNGDKVAFDGSFNESNSGHVSNRERAQVFRSWVEQDHDRLFDTIHDIDEEWKGLSPDLDIYPLGSDIVEKIKKIAPNKKPTATPDKALEKWRHQDEAVSKFLQEKRGILEMATGTGKTKTALKIVKKLCETGKINSVIISTYGNSLLSQWEQEVQDWRTENIDTCKFRLYRDFGQHAEMQKYLNIIDESILIVSRDANKLQDLLLNNRIKKHMSKLLIIHDEIHGFGSESLVNKLSGSHNSIAYRLGLSATPEREYDKIGSSFLTEEIGPVIFQFPIDKAIERGILCEFNYHVVNFEYTKNDKKKIQKIRAAEAEAAKAGNPWDRDILFRKLSLVRKKAESKPELLDNFLANNKDLLKSSILFVQDKDQGDSIAKIVSKYTGRFATFYEGKSENFIEMLSDGSIDTLIACERLNEGVDIRSLENIFLIATPRAKLVTIQRIGRCLRIDPSNEGKVANVIDFILDGDVDDHDNMPADKYREEWIRELAQKKRKL